MAVINPLMRMSFLFIENVNTAIVEESLKSQNSKRNESTSIKISLIFVGHEQFVVASSLPDKIFTDAK